jgi:hypothetical protein
VILPLIGYNESQFQRRAPLITNVGYSLLSSQTRRSMKIGEFLRRRSMRTRKSIGIGIGLVLLAIVVALFVGSWQKPAQPPLRAGMTIAEVQALMGPTGHVANELRL